MYCLLLLQSVSASQTSRAQQGLLSPTDFAKPVPLAAVSLDSRQGRDSGNRHSRISNVSYLNSLKPWHKMPACLCNMLSHSIQLSKHYASIIYMHSCLADSKGYLDFNSQTNLWLKWPYQVYITKILVLSYMCMLLLDWLLLCYHYIV